MEFGKELLKDVAANVNGRMEGSFEPCSRTVWRESGANQIGLLCRE